jgi:hypothetical protein
VIDADFHLAANMRAFESCDTPGLIRYEPDAMVVPLRSALTLADQRLRAVLDLPSLKFAIVVLSSVELSVAGPLTPRHRDVLWKAFGLPVFEHLRGPDGTVIARECEVHDGLHLDENTRFAAIPGVPTEIVDEQCDCGIATRRLRYLGLPRSRAAAA